MLTAAVALVVAKLKSAFSRLTTPTAVAIKKKGVAEAAISSISGSNVKASRKINIGSSAITVTWDEKSMAEFARTNKTKIQGDLKMGIEADIAAVGHDIVVDAEAIAAKVKASAESIFAKAKVEAVAVEGTLAQEFTKVKTVVDSHAAILATKVESASKADLAAVEAKIDALIAKVGIKL